MLYIYIIFKLTSFTLYYYIKNILYIQNLQDLGTPKNPDLSCKNNESYIKEGTYKCIPLPKSQSSVEWRNALSTIEHKNSTTKLNIFQPNIEIIKSESGGTVTEKALWKSDINTARNFTREMLITKKMTHKSTFSQFQPTSRECRPTPLTIP